MNDEILEVDGTSGEVKQHILADAVVGPEYGSLTFKPDMSEDAIIWTIRMSSEDGDSVEFTRAELKALKNMLQERVAEKKQEADSYDAEMRARWDKLKRSKEDREKKI